ncbi:MAG: hypothetical protein WCR69_05560 [Sulfuricurvum sp.]
MSLYFLEFRDPLFGVIIFLMIVVLVALFSYWFGKFKKRDDSRHLDSFLQKYQVPPTQNEIEDLVKSSSISVRTWLQLAEAFAKSAAYDKSIEIYTELLRHPKASESKKEILFLLGKSYFSAGFLQRAEQTFLQILSAVPRTPQALSYLMLVYEQLRNYSKAIEILEPLSELKSDVSGEEAYLHTLCALNEASLSREQKALKLLEIYKQARQLDHAVFGYVFGVDSDLAWQNLDLSRSHLIVDILWGLRRDELELEVVMQSAFLRELYTAKGYIDAAKKSSYFELDLLINLPSYSQATLGFEYVCSGCKTASPFSFVRCGSCHAIDTQMVEMVLVKSARSASEESNSFL